MQSYQISLTPHKRVAGRFIASVRRAIQKALAEEHATGITQAGIATKLGVNRSVIHRQIMGFENLTLGTVGEIASALGREPHFSMEATQQKPGTIQNVQSGTTSTPLVDGAQQVLASST
jgi:hypothetical protein